MMFAPLFTIPYRFGIIWAMDKKLGNEQVCCLSDELAKHIGKMVYIGARSSFFFIGPAEEALASLTFLVLMMRRIASLFLSTRKYVVNRRLKSAQEDGVKLGERKVKKVYNHDMADDGVVVIIEGKEFGMFWTREEYLVQKKLLLEAIEKNR